MFCWSIVVHSQTPQLVRGFPLFIEHRSAAPIQPVIADIDGNGLEEVITTNSSSPHKIFAIQFDASNLPGWPVNINSLAYAIGCGDIDNDGHLEVVARTKQYLYAWKSNGTVVTGFPVTLTTSTNRDPDKTILLYDLDRNHTLEIITVTYNTIQVHNYNGTIHAGWPKTLSQRYASNPTVGDLDNDGFPEIVVSDYTPIPIPDSSISYVYVFTADGQLKPHWPILLDSNFISGQSATIVNIDNDDSLEIIFPSIRLASDTNIVTFEGRISIYSVSGLRKRQWNSPSTRNVRDFGEISVGNVNADSNLELCATIYSSETYVFDSFGRVLPGWPYPGITAFYGTPILVDIDNDTVPEIFVNHSTSYPDSGLIFAFYPNGEQLRWSPLSTYGNTSLTKPLFNDLNKDGSIEMVLLTIIPPDSIGGNEKMALSVYTFPGAHFTKKGSPWPQLEHDRQNTFQYGYIPSDNVVSVPAFEDNPLQFSLSQNYPNPFNPKTAIGFSLLAVSNVTLKVYDILGKEVVTLIHNELMDAGKHEVTFDGSDVPSGIYYYRLTAGKFTETKKFVVVR